MKYGNDLDIGNNHINNVALQQLASDPGSPVEGQFWENTTTHVMKAFLNGVVVTFASGGGVANAYGSIVAGGVTAAAIGSDSIAFNSANSAITIASVNGGAGADTVTWTLVASAIDHNSLANLTTGDPHTQYVLSAGRAGGQTVNGGTGASDNYTINSTSNATKGLINVGLAIFNHASGLITANGKIQTVTDPTASQDAATKNYVDLAVQGVSFETSNVATTAALPANSYSNIGGGVGATLTATSNGTLTVDGVLTALNDIILVKNEAAAANNGLYKVTTAGAAGAAYVLTRHTGADTSAELSGATTAVQFGTVNAGSLWILAVTAPVVGTTALNWTEMNKAADLTPGTGITISGQTVSVATTYAGGGSIVTVGALSAGSLAAGFTIVGLALGGTGVDSSSNGTAARDATHLGKQTTAPAAATNVTVTPIGIVTGAVFTLTHTGAATAFTCTHNMNNSNPHVSVQDAAGNGVIVNWQATNANTVVVTWDVAQANTTVFKVTIIG